MKFALKKIPIFVSGSIGKQAETLDELIIALKTVRGILLDGSDWTQVADSPLSDDIKEEWKIWRQNLRDLTKTITVENVGEWFEVPNPPNQGAPSAWSNLEYENFNEIINQIIHLNNHH
jgi:hypothetical protein